MDKNKAIIKYLMQCPTIKNNPVFFNFGEVEDNSKQIVTTSTDKNIERPYIDGSVLKRYTFTIIDYRSVIYQALVTIEGYDNENVEDMMDVQSIIDWIDEQNDNYNFPDFGNDCVVEEITALTDIPNLNGVDKDSSPNLAKYSIAIRVQYLDNTKKIWK